MPAIVKRPSTEKKLDLLSASARHDVCLSSCNRNALGGTGRIRDPNNPLTRWIYPAHLPNKGYINILKILQTNSCKNNCAYCDMAAHRDSVPRLTFKPDELAAVFMKFVARHLAHGIFLSSGIRGNPDTSMDMMIRTAEILRKHYEFNGYIHLKLLPGASYNLVEHAARLADRISINLEAPTRQYLQKIAPEKKLVRDLISRMKWAGDLVKDGSRAKSHTTQFVVGASGESDLDIIKTVDWIYRELNVFRAYFSALQTETASPYQRKDILLREHRLYQSDFLLRGYGFSIRDLIFNEAGDIPLQVDPKLAHALFHPEIFPVDVNTADKSLLLKVPGIGPVSARRILGARQRTTFRNISDLKHTGALIVRAAPYIEFSGKRDRESGWTQQELFNSQIIPGWRSGIEPLQ